MPTVFAIANRRSRFDPPTPDGVSPATVVGGVALLVGAVALDELTGGVLGALAILPGPARREPTPEELAALAAQLTAGTAAPAIDERGTVPCTGCGERVAYGSMALCEDGYFCARCATV